MKKIVLLLLIICFVLRISNAQKNITGKVTDAGDGSALPGVSVMIKGTSGGTITNAEGNFSISIEEKATLIFSFVGMQTQEIQVKDKSVIDVQLHDDAVNLEEVIVAGVASRTSKKKLTVTVAKITNESLEDVTPTSVATALQGKVAGVHITLNTGNPGDAASIQLRGATIIAGSQSPLIIVDDIMIEGILTDINSDDIESIEVVKGASASALYGSKAANGVVHVTTKRGSYLKPGTTEIKIRNEYGITQLSKSLPLSEHHPYILKDHENPGTDYTDYFGVTYPDDYTGGTSSEIVGSRSISADHYADNPYFKVNNLQDAIFETGEYYTNYVSVANSKEKTNMFLSYEHSKNKGILVLTDGYTRDNFRINADHYIFKTLKLSVSNLVGKTSTNDPGGQYYTTGGIFFNVLALDPDIDLYRTNEEDGSAYDLNASHWNTNEENPLYDLNTVSKEDTRNLVMGSYKLEWMPFEWLTLEGKYTFERTQEVYTEFTPIDHLARSGDGLEADQGYLYKYNDYVLSQTQQFTAHLNKSFGKFTTKGKVSYLYEDYHAEAAETIGYDFAISGLPDFDAIEGEVSASSEIYDIRAENIFGIAQFDYDAKYLADIMVRYDGSSLFGENERWKLYHRFSVGYRISEDVKIHGIDELKIRAAHGTSGLRPNFEARYNTFTITNGETEKSTVGNPDLKPTKAIETEFAINIDFLKRFGLEAIYSMSRNEDQVLRAPLLVAKGGYEYQWQNAATLEAKSFEATLNVKLINNTKFKWDITLLFDRIRTKITKLDVPAYQIGPIGQDANQAFYIREGETFGIMYGNRWVTSLEQMENQLEDDESINDYELNSDGYVVPAGSHGTSYEIPEKVEDEDGNTVKDKIGDTNPDFNLGLSSTMSYKSWSLYFLLDWKNGGDVYNRTKQWLYRDLRHVDIDQSGKAENKKKAYDYYITIYDENDINAYFVEDASYLKLRELALYYSVPAEKLTGFAKGFIKKVKFGFVGRGLITITNYTGYDPEVGQINDSSEDGYSQFFAFDAFGYPSHRTYSFSLELKF